MSENARQEHVGDTVRPRALTLTAYVERAERELAKGPTMADWLGEIQQLDWGTVTANDLIAEIREWRDRHEV
ncbi:hypothetical protein Lesp02_57170 [Lentzea sp. NBRC 105346]|uniref:hypothetical protein n=1 Tax=Lentzea sp. NBRC 105346 TaxID=3032205 RepID=UPI0024A016FF|nr:hypothetical protein [Lentzea sp. NBRC 105346]GLZ33529.1 hypothetical protein Lesp02_57170 [Lentzea sp. NBRC 105346]